VQNKIIHENHILKGWNDYELIDTGEFEKLERFGKYILRRPEPQAIWGKTLKDNDWLQLPHATFTRFKNAQKTEDSGEWILKSDMPQQWIIQYKYKEMNLAFRLGLTAFKHIGVFPEQYINWNEIYDSVHQIRKNGVAVPKVLNLFAYTGGVSLAAKSAGADVIHVDAVKPVLTWANQNQELSKLNNIRWVCEDAVQFVQREIKRGNAYDLIILDPPAYGRGPKGEKWELEKMIQPLINNISKLLKKNLNNKIILNCYSLGLSSYQIVNLFNEIDVDKFNFGELIIIDNSNKLIPLSIYVKASN
jgi:23S rRNA (cytosine1962-C5)-methyltransferase